MNYLDRQADPPKSGIFMRYPHATNLFVGSKNNKPPSKQIDGNMCLTSVPDGPEVETERATVHTGIGLEAQLVCIVHAEPAPQVSLA